MRWNLAPLLPNLPRRAKSAYLCAWCLRHIGPHRGRLQGEPTVKYGLCRNCLNERLSQLSERLPEARSEGWASV